MTQKEMNVLQWPRISIVFHTFSKVGQSSFFKGIAELQKLTPSCKAHHSRRNHQSTHLKTQSDESE